MNRPDLHLSLTIMGSLLCGVWVAFFLSFHVALHTVSAWVVIVVAVLSILLLRKLPLVAAALILLASAASALAHVPYGEIELLLPTVIVIAHLGRFRPHGAFCALILAGLAGFTALRPGASALAVPVFIVIYGGAFGLGLVVRRRANLAAHASRESASLAAIDLERTITSASRVARHGATTQALATLRGAVERMRELAVRLHESGAPYATSDVEAIRLEADTAIARLHDTLTLLDRSADVRTSRSGGTSTEVQSGAQRAQSAGPSRATPRAQVLTATGWVACAAVLVGSIVVAVFVGDAHPHLMIAAIVVPLCTVTVGRARLISALVAAGGFVVAALDPETFPPETLVPLAAALGMIIWKLAREPIRQTWLPIAIVSAGAILLAMRFDRQGTGFIVALIVLTSLAAIAWREPDEILRAEQDRSTRLLAGIAAATVRAERAARLELAQELHDGVSHGITAVTLQVAAAHAMASNEPERAHRALESAIAIGERTALEIDVLSRGSRVDERLSLQTLITGARWSGLRITVNESSDADLLSYRIVQEALTNIARYAPGAAVTVQSGQDHGNRFVRVIDDGAAVRGRAQLHELGQLGTGRGLSGLAARVSERGGAFTAARVGSGFEVYAHWPVTATSQIDAIEGKGTA